MFMCLVINFNSEIFEIPQWGIFVYTYILASRTYSDIVRVRQNSQRYPLGFQGQAVESVSLYDAPFLINKNVGLYRPC